MSQKENVSSITTKKITDRTFENLLEKISDLKDEVKHYGEVKKLSHESLDPGDIKDAAMILYTDTELYIIRAQNQLEQMSDMVSCAIAKCKMRDEELRMEIENIRTNGMINFKGESYDIKSVSVKKRKKPQKGILHAPI